MGRACQLEGKVILAWAALLVAGGRLLRAGKDMRVNGVSSVAGRTYCTGCWCTAQG